jgi:hypothetical protein
MSDRTMTYGRPIVGSATECRTYRAGRVCSASGCTTVLSVYNPNRYCALHERQQVESSERPWSRWRSA